VHFFHWNFLVFLPLDGSGSRSTQVSESGSNLDLDPQPWFNEKNRGLKISWDCPFKIITVNVNFFKHLNMKTSIKCKNEPAPALLRNSNRSNEIKKDTKISWNYPFYESFCFHDNFCENFCLKMHFCFNPMPYHIRFAPTVLLSNTTSMCIV
jgi:hypothetical protein